MNQQIEETKEKQERERKKLIAEEKHKQWVQKKNEEVKRVKNCFSLSVIYYVCDMAYSIYFNVDQNNILVPKLLKSTVDF